MKLITVSLDSKTDYNHVMSLVLLRNSPGRSTLYKSKWVIVLPFRGQKWGCNLVSSALRVLKLCTVKVVIFVLEGVNKVETLVFQTYTNEFVC